MITAVLFIIGSALVSFMALIFSGIQFLIPTAIQNGITTLFQFIGYGAGYFPVDQVLTAFIFMYGFLVSYYFVRICVMGLNMIPGVSISLPHIRRR